MFRYYWVVAKFVLTVVAVVGLLLHQFTAVEGAARRVGAAAPGTMPEVGGLGIQLVADSGLGLLILLVTATLGVYKPWGGTKYGRSEQKARRDASPDPASSSSEAAVLRRGNEFEDGFPRGLKIALVIVGAILVVVVVVHLAGGGLGHHGH